MATDRAANDDLRHDLDEAYHTYERVSFMPQPPDGPLLARWQAQGERAARVLLGMPSLPTMLLRLRDHLLRRQIPILPYLCELLTTAVWRVFIGRYVQIGPGLIIPHGHIVIDGEVRIGRDCVINPWVTIGLSASWHAGLDTRGPTIGDRVFIGTGAKVLGAISVGDDVRIGANAVVVDDVPSGATAVGAPARVIERSER